MTARRRMRDVRHAQTKTSELKQKLPRCADVMKIGMMADRWPHIPRREKNVYKQSGGSE
jgi:hypothetical protein